MIRDIGWGGYSNVYSADCQCVPKYSAVIYIVYIFIWLGNGSSTFHNVILLTGLWSTDTVMYDHNEQVQKIDSISWIKIETNWFTENWKHIAVSGSCTYTNFIFCIPTLNLYIILETWKCADKKSTFRFVYIFSSSIWLCAAVLG